MRSNDRRRLFAINSSVDLGNSRLLLNKYNNASAAYSLRRLDRNYAGNAVRVRRSYDDAESDIGFNGNELDETALLNHCVPSSVQALYNNRMYWEEGSDDRVSIPLSTAFWDGGNNITMKVVASPTLNGLNRLFEVNQSVAGQQFRVLVGVAGKLYFRHSFSTSGDAIWEGDNPIELGKVLEISITYDSSSVANDPVITINGSPYPVTETTAPVGTADTGDGVLILGNNVGTFIRAWGGTIYDVTLGTSFYEGYGNQNSDWVDQVNSSNGTVGGSPSPFTGQDFNGFIVNKQDQTTSDADAAQSTAASQPKIFSNGSVVKQNTKPIILYDNNDLLRIPDADMPTLTTMFQIVAVVKNDASDLSGPQGIVAHYLTTGDQRSWYFNFAADEKLSVVFGDPTNGTFESTYKSLSAITTNELQVVAVQYNAGTVRLYKNGVELPSASEFGTTPSTLFNSTSDWTIGATASGFSWNGQIGDVYIADNLTDDIVRVQQEMMAYWGIS